MEAKARQTDIKMTARKLRRVINEVRGKSVVEAQDMLRFMPYFAARVVEKNLKAAVANAQEKYGVGAESLKVSEIFADESVTYKRARTRAQGRMYKRLKRTSHLTLKVSAEGIRCAKAAAADPLKASEQDVNVKDKGK